MPDTSLHTLRLATILTLLAAPCAAHAQSAFDTLKSAGDTSHARSSTVKSSRSQAVEPGQHLRLDAHKQMLRMASKVEVEPWLTPSGKNRFVDIMSQECQGFVLMEESVKGTMHLGDPVTTFMVELATGERFDTLNSMAELNHCEGDYVVFESRTMGPAAFHIPSKKWLEPELIFPAGVKLRPTQMITPVEREDGPASEFMVRAFPEGDDTPYQGVWTLGEPSITLTQHMPWDGVHMARLHDEVIDVIGFDLQTQTYTEMFGDGKTSTRTSILPLLYRVDEAITHLHTLEERDRATFLPGGYTALTRAGEALIIHPDGEQERLEVEGCERHHTPTLSAQGSTSALFTCRMGHDDSTQAQTYRFVYWTPDGTTSWAEEFSGQLSMAFGHTTMSSTRQHPIGAMTVYPPGIGQQTSHMWFDTRSGAIWEGKARYSIHIAPRAIEPRSLATDMPHVETDIDSSKRINLYLVDLDAGTETLLHTYTDCPGALQTHSVAGDFMSIDCVTNDKPGHFRFIQQWSEVLDLRDGTRWRAPHTRSVRSVFADGSFIVGDVDKGDNILYKASRKLWFGRFD